MTSSNLKQQFHAVMYEGSQARELSELASIRRPKDTKKQLLWVDLLCDSTESLRSVVEQLELPTDAVELLACTSSTPQVRSFDDWFCVLAVAVVHTGRLVFEGAVLTIVSGPGFVITSHREPVSFITELRAREGGTSRLGYLDSDSFVASLLDWHLGTFFEAISDFEREVERVENLILAESFKETNEDLRRLRKGASRLRRMLAPHRKLFSSLARPDFRPDQSDSQTKRFENLDSHFERAMDVVENARDLMIGSFELFSNQIALRTNENMRALTFYTVVIGSLAVISGVLGMNFEEPFFKSSPGGFWYVIIGMVAIIFIAIVLARRTARI